jgi:hypothetical protein
MTPKRSPVKRKNPDVTHKGCHAICDARIANGEDSVFCCECVPHDNCELYKEIP